MMEVTYVLIIMLVAYVFGAITKVFITVIPDKYIPLQNVIIGFLSAVVCYFTKLETNLLDAIVLCLISTMSASGIDDLIKIRKNN